MQIILFYLVVSSFIIGIFARSFFVISYDWLLIALAFSAFFALWWRRQKVSLALYVSVFLFLATLGVLRFDVTTWINEELEASKFIGKEVIIEGVINKDPDISENTTHIQINSATVNGRAINDGVLLFTERHPILTYGDVVIATGKLQKPEAFLTDLGRTFNYPGYLEAQGVSYVMYYPEVELVGSGQKNIFITNLLSFKHRFMDSLESLIPEPQVGLAEGLLLGVKSALGDELEEVFRRTGIIHIVVLSGYNVMLVVIFVMTILSYFLGERIRLIFGVLAIASFALMVGLSATVVRASIMAVLILVAKATGRSYAVLRALFFAGFVMLLINPYLLVSDPGFQLSFVATFGLILLAPHLEMLFHKVPSVIGIREFFVATIATQIFVLPLLLYQIGEFSVVAVLVNVLVLPMVPVAMLLTFFSGVLGLFSSALALPVAYLTHLSLSYILVVATWFSALPFASYVVPPFPLWVMVLAYIVLGLLIWKVLAEKSDTKHDEHITLDGWTIEDEINKKEMAELSPRDNSAIDNSASTPIFFR